MDPDFSGNSVACLSVFTAYIGIVIGDYFRTLILGY